MMQEILPAEVKVLSREVRERTHRSVAHGFKEKTPQTTPKRMSSHHKDSRNPYFWVLVTTIQLRSLWKNIIPCHPFGLF